MKKMPRAQLATILQSNRLDAAFSASTLGMMEWRNGVMAATTEHVAPVSKVYGGMPNE